MKLILQSVHASPLITNFRKEHRSPCMAKQTGRSCDWQRTGHESSVSRLLTPISIFGERYSNQHGGLSFSGLFPNKSLHIHQPSFKMSSFGYVSSLTYSWMRFFSLLGCRLVRNKTEQSIYPEGLLSWDGLSLPNQVSTGVEKQSEWVYACLIH